MRQSAVYQKHVRKPGNSVWIFVSISQVAEARLQDYMVSVDEMSYLNPFDLHLLILDTAIANWRPYLVHIATEISGQVCQAYEGICSVVLTTNRLSVQFWLTLMELEFKSRNSRNVSY